jgi:SagB-type dehydrogenase family enzyme
MNLENLNRNIEETWKYHNATKHSYMSVRTSTHFLDWDNQPSPYKVYLDVKSIPLPRDFPELKMPMIEAISTVLGDSKEESLLSLLDLANILFHSAGVIRRKTFPGGASFDFRAAACAGALYPIEIYVVCKDLPDLEAGVYHFSPRDFALKEIRKGDWRGVLASATGDEDSVKRAPLILVYTAITWRSSWKYQARSYRYHFWDVGTIIANTLAISTAYNTPAKVVAGFVDKEVNNLLGIDDGKEISLCLVPIGKTMVSPILPDEVPKLDVKTLPLSKEEVDYPAIRRMHYASSLKSKEEVINWHGRAPHFEIPKLEGRLFYLKDIPSEEMPMDTVQEVIARRGSTRMFSHHSITFQQLSTIINRATGGIPADFLEPAGASLNDMYIIVNAVSGIPSGSYFLHRDKKALELLREGSFRQASGYLTLEQSLGRDASAVVFFMSDLNRILEQFGNRGYRAVQLESGIIGGKLYLGAYALNLGATGLTFYDDDVTEFFSPHAKGKSTIFVVALGVPAGKGEQ